MQSEQNLSQQLRTENFNMKIIPKSNCGRNTQLHNKKSDPGISLYIQISV